MKIAIILANIKIIGGVERITSNLSNMFKDFSICDCCIYSIYSTDSSIGNNNYDIKVPVNYILSKNDSIINLEQNLVEHIKRDRITHVIIQVQDFYLALDISNICKKINIKAICVLHSSPNSYLKKYTKNENWILAFLKQTKTYFYWRPKYKKLLGRIINNCDAFICISNKTRLEVNSLFPNSKNIFTIYNPILISHKDTIISAKKNIVVYAGRLTASKGLLDVLIAWKMIKSSTKDWFFYIIGDGEQRKQLQDFCIKNNLDNVKFLGSINNVYDYLKQSKIAVLNSFTEGLPTFLIEAAYFKNALLGLDGYGGTSDIIKNDYNGYLYNSKDVNIKDALLKLIDNPNIIEQFGNNSVKYISKFDVKFVAEDWRRLLNNL